ncbi:unnamed protein product [Larinioides sclopetarius]|uniref:Uncharacterized protein n=1 Tax=Larinioides sclopetarius TaxID=280406 RepID=A0AAV1ZMQ1_9ARAC
MILRVKNCVWFLLVELARQTFYLILQNGK